MVLMGACVSPIGVAAQAVFFIPDFGRDKAANQVLINWTDYTIRAIGRGAPSLSAGNHHSPYHALAKARQEAYRRLLRAGKSVQLTPEQTVGEVLGKNVEMLAEFENLAKRAAVIETAFLSTGSVEIKLELPMTGEFSSLVLPEAVTRLKEIGSSRLSTGADELSNHTGLVVDARGVAVEPALCFQILDKDGQEVYGPAYASRENAVAAGMCQYVRGIENVGENPRIGNNPLTVKAIRVRPPGASDIVISDTDAARLRDSVEHLAFLKQCRIVVVLE